MTNRLSRCFRLGSKYSKVACKEDRGIRHLQCLQRIYRQRLGRQQTADAMKGNGLQRIVNEQHGHTGGQLDVLVPIVCWYNRDLTRDSELHSPAKIAWTPSLVRQIRSWKRYPGQWDMSRRGVRDQHGVLELFGTSNPPRRTPWTAGPPQCCLWVRMPLG